MPSSLRLASFAPRAGAALALATRLYLASIWWTFGMLKIRAGWITAASPDDNALRPLLELIAAGRLPSTWPVFQPIAEMLLATGLDALLVVAIPVTELALAVAFATGTAPRLAALIGIAVNLGLIAAGIGDPLLDGRVVALQLLVIATGPLAGAWGVPAIVRARRARRPRARWRRDDDPCLTPGNAPTPRGGGR